MNIKVELIQKIDYLLSTSDKVNIYNRSLLLIERKDCDFKIVEEVYYNNNLVLEVKYGSYVRINLKTTNRYIIKDLLDCIKECVKYEEDKESNTLKILEEEYNK